VLTRAHGTAAGYIFLAPKKEVAESGPLILDDRGQVVWFKSLGQRGVTAFRVQRYRGRPVLTWWQGKATKGVGKGHYVIVDSSYRRVAEVSAGHGLEGDIHEFLITPRDTALLTIYNRVPYDLSALGGPKDGSVLEGVVQELDIATGRVLFEWHSLAHVGLGESYEAVPKKEPYDYFHVNSIDVDADGNLLVSARHTHAIYKLRRSDGGVIWRLGGKKSDFRLGRGVRFGWQHDARRQPDGTITLFDNHAENPKRGSHSRVLVLRLDERRRTATLVRSYAHPSPALLSTSQGNAEFLPDGHVFVGWGSNPYLTEFDRAGHVLFDARFGGGGADSYRAFRFPWAGTPTDRPAVAVRPPDGDGVAVAVSWNGATEVSRWRVRAGRTPGSLRPVAVAAKTGFETVIEIASTASYFAVEALDRKGRVLRASKPVRRGAGSSSVSTG